MARFDKSENRNYKREQNQFSNFKRGNDAEAPKFTREKASAAKAVLGALNLSDTELNDLINMPTDALQKLCINFLNNKFGKTHNIVENNIKGKEKGVEKIFKRIDITPKNGEKKSVPEIIFAFTDDNKVNINISPYYAFDKASYSGKEISIDKAFSEAYMYCAKGETYLKLKRSDLKETNVDVDTDPNDYI